MRLLKLNAVYSCFGVRDAFGFRVVGDVITAKTPQARGHICREAHRIRPPPEYAAAVFVRRYRADNTAIISTITTVEEHIIVARDQRGRRLPCSFPQADSTHFRSCIHQIARPSRQTILKQSNRRDQPRRSYGIAASQAFGAVGDPYRAQDLRAVVKSWRWRAGKPSERASQGPCDVWRDEDPGPES
eukprot:scaffold58247_cov47-Prasinocladus_malaysianus.AAC.1